MGGRWIRRKEEGKRKAEHGGGNKRRKGEEGKAAYCRRREALGGLLKQAAWADLLKHSRRGQGRGRQVVGSGTGQKSAHLRRRTFARSLTPETNRTS